jgi:hypothetical protein
MSSPKRNTPMEINKKNINLDNFDNLITHSYREEIESSSDEEENYSGFEEHPKEEEDDLSALSEDENDFEITCLSKEEHKAKVNVVIKLR